MNKTILFLADGMADEPLAELDGKTPIEYARTPDMDRIAREGASGIFQTLIDGFPTSSDVANLGVMGYDIRTNYTGRGPLEAMSQGIEMQPTDVAFRCNLVTTDGEVLVDYSGGHIEHAAAVRLVTDLAHEFNSEAVTFLAGVSYRNLLMLHGAPFSPNVKYAKPDDHQGDPIGLNRIEPADDSRESMRTCELVNDLIERTQEFLASHPINRRRHAPANMIWPQSPGRRPAMQPFSEKYGGVKGAIISAVDVIFGLGVSAGMDVIKVPGATGFVDTNYEGKADAAVAALADHDFVYLHMEAADECSHMGDLKLKLQAIEDIDSRVIARVRAQLEGAEVTYALLPDHPVPINLRKHTRTPIPVAISGRHIPVDACKIYSETAAQNGGLGFLAGDLFMKRVLDIL